jgi:hypothetical protein
LPPPLPVGGAGDFSTGGGDADGPLVIVWLASGGLVDGPVDSEGDIAGSLDDGDGLTTGDVLKSVVNVLLLGWVPPLLPQPAASPMVAIAPQKVSRAVRPLCSRKIMRGSISRRFTSQTVLSRGVTDASCCDFGAQTFAQRAHARRNRAA